MPLGPVLLDTDTLSELSRANPNVTLHARSYLLEFGRLTISSVTVFERLRGYRQALRAGKPYHKQMQAFQALVQTCVVLPFDEDAANVVATIWSACQRQNLGDILIAAVALARQIPLVTRNRRDFEAIAAASSMDLHILDWTATAKTRAKRIQ